jgi:hypothetical protein
MYPKGAESGAGEILNRQHLLHTIAESGLGRPHSARRKKHSRVSRILPETPEKRIRELIPF